ncbi:hypothetical protein ACIRF8_35425 [Streptomyces sp. NPDC102406]|uniref:hypothetical protein n=1 Tax=Streptomyces sp. NPDC102406 TaxID=3366171 RepID=UPI00380B499A
MIRKAAASVSVAVALLVASPAAAWAAPSAAPQDPTEVCKKLVELVKVLNPSAPAADLDKLCEPKSQTPTTPPSPSSSTPPSSPQ